MHLPLPALLDVLWALDEETRLRIAVLMQHGELTVSDLTDILGMSQPRVSRHLNLLAEAGVVDKHREGTWAFFDLVTTGPIGQLVQGVLTLTDASDSVLAADLDRLTIVRGRRAAAAQEYFAGVAPRWDEERSLHASDAIVEQAILETIGTTTYGSVLDVGTGTGRMLQLLATHATRAVGFDSSRSMLAVARANLERAEIRCVDLRQGDIYSPPLATDSFDLIVIHQVLHFLDDPGRAIREISRLLVPGGRMLVVDFAPHGLEFLRSDHAHVRLGFRADSVAGWLEQSGLEVAPDRADRDRAVVERPDGERLTVSLWLGRDRRTADVPVAANEEATR